MKILMVNTFHYEDMVGGAEIMMRQLSEGLINRGYSVSFLTFSTTSKYFFKETESSITSKVPITNLYLPSPNLPKKSLIEKLFWHTLNIYNPLSQNLFKKEVSKIKPDVIIFHNTYGWSPSVLGIPKKFKIRTIQMLHDLHFLCYRNMFIQSESRNCKKQCAFCKLVKYPYKKLSKKVNAVVGVSRFILDTYLKYGYFSNISLREVIHNVRVLNYKTDKCELYYKSEDFIKIGYIGSIVKYKGIENLLKVFTKIKNSFESKINKNIILLIAGIGSEDYISYLKNKYKSDNIFWLGYKKPEEIFPCIDFLVVPSIINENLPTVIVESHLYGKPVLAANVGGIPELIKRDFNGILYEPLDLEDFEKKLYNIILNINYWKQMKNNISEYAQKVFSYQDWLNKWESLILKVMKTEFS